MINIVTQEYVESNLAIRVTKITLFNFIPIYKYKKTSTNSKAIAILTPQLSKKEIKGFV